MDERNRYNLEELGLPKLSLPVAANPKFASLSFSELNKRGCRIIGGDLGDLEFNGYTIENGETILDRPVLVTMLDLDNDEIEDISNGILQFSFESIGIETVEHS